MQSNLYFVLVCSCRLNLDSQLVVKPAPKPGKFGCVKLRDSNVKPRRMPIRYSICITSVRFGLKLKVNNSGIWWKAVFAKVLMECGIGATKFLDSNSKIMNFGC